MGSSLGTLFWYPLFTQHHGGFSEGPSPVDIYVPVSEGDDGAVGKYQVSNSKDQSSAHLLTFGIRSSAPARCTKRCVVEAIQTMKRSRIEMFPLSYLTSFVTRFNARVFCNSMLLYHERSSEISPSLSKAQFLHANRMLVIWVCLPYQLHCNLTLIPYSKGGIIFAVCIRSQARK